MNPRIALLALTAFAAGMAETLVGGILGPVASNLNVSLSAAGQLTGVFSLTFGLTAPLLFYATARVERRRLLLTTLALFALTNIAAALSPNYAALFASRVASAACCALIVVLATTLASQLVEPALRGRAIGAVFMGISSSLVLGVPAGILLAGAAGWRAPFAAIAVLSLLLIGVLRATLPVFAPRPPPPLSRYWNQLATPRLLAGHLVSILLIGGHFTLFAYLAPYVGQELGLVGDTVGGVFLLFGVAAVAGGYLGGWLSDTLGARRALALIPALFLAALAALPLASAFTPLFLVAMVAWSALSWTISPAVQNYLIETSPDDAEAGIGVNSSAMHLGVALGSAFGGAVLAWRSIDWNPWAGCVLVALSLAVALGAARARPLAAS
ncbi:MFS transporter [Crenobacter cavernae]|uniref:MFS transporter n=1 Tax=Crenobacter cavernae TaxID=2290923 RepID=A0A345Y462_9NEIS|nr:MFS transporter [Crenobacter cavernae]AXK38714.1 MFS transporter [Crenobacter cavernae]